jgi:hypothetical protein
VKLSDKITISQQVISRHVGDETVIVDLRSGTYFGVDPVGARIWQLMQDGKNLAEICNVMLDEYEVTFDDLERDVLALAQSLSAKNLISME